MLDNIYFIQWADSVQLAKSSPKIGGCKEGLSVFDKNSNLKCSTSCPSSSWLNLQNSQGLTVKPIRTINQEFRQSVQANSV